MRRLFPAKRVDHILHFEFPSVRIRGNQAHPPVSVLVRVPKNMDTGLFNSRSYHWNADPLPGRKSTVALHEQNVPGNYRYTLTDKTRGKNYLGNTMVEAAQRMVDDN